MTKKAKVNAIGAENTAGKEPASGAVKKGLKGFLPGKSGNPKGRPKGSRNKATLAAATLLEGEAEEITRTCVALAKAGDMTAMRLCLERILPPQRSRPIELKLPKIETAADLSAAFALVLGAAAAGDLTLEEASTVTGILE